MPFLYSKTVLPGPFFVILLGWGACTLFQPPPYTVYAPTHSSLEQLGRYLFFDPRLSATGGKSCAGCHDPALFFTDGYRRSPGIYADPALRNAPSLLNTAHLKALNWANPSVTTFEAQMLRPLFNDSPIEMGLKGSHESTQIPYIQDSFGLPFQRVLTQMATDTLYGRLSTSIWGITPQEWTQRHVIEAIAAYEKTLISFNSPYDNWLKGHKDALSPEAEAGRQLFFSKRLGCGNCHSGTLLTDHKMYNIGLYNTQPDGSYPPSDQGLYEETFHPADKGRFRTPSLRNIARTAPYFHDGSAENLNEVLLIFSAGGRNIMDGLLAGDGRNNVNKSDKIQPFVITTEEKRHLILFLESLTDSTVLVNPWFQNPFHY